MHEFWTIRTTNTTYTRLQSYTKYGGWRTWNTTIKIVVDVLLFLLLSSNVFVITNAHPL